MAKRKTFIAKHILEVRQEKKAFEFLDYRGELVDALLEETSFDRINIKNDSSRIEVASNNLDQSYFFGIENFGFQIEAQQDFEGYSTAVDKVFSFIKKFSKYKIEKVFRVGTKSVIFCNIPSRGEEGLRELFFNNLFANKSSFEEKTSMKIDDLAYSFFHAEKNNIKTHLEIGPGNLNEVTEKYFGVAKAPLYLPFKKQSGVIFVEDTYSEKLGKLNNSELKNRIETQIDLIKNSFEGFISIFDEKTK